MARPSAIKLLKRLATNLSGDGFALDDKFRLKREAPGIHQFIEVQQGRGSLTGKLTVNLAWQFIADGAGDSKSYDFLANMGYLMWSSQLWIDTVTSENFEPLVVATERQIRDHGLPFLDRFQNIRVMLDAYEVAAAEQRPITTPIDPQLFFGIDAGWKNFQLAFAYKHVGRTDKARQHFETVIGACSQQSFSWIQIRKQRCLAALSDLA